MSKSLGFDSLALHAGFTPDARHGSRAVPIHQTTSYMFENSEHAAALYNLEVGGHLYSRISNPTVAVLENRLAALDGGGGGGGDRYGYGGGVFVGAGFDGTGRPYCGVLANVWGQYQSA